MTSSEAPRLRFGPCPGPGRLITIDGLDGSGKTTLAASLRDHLTAAGVPVLTTRFPTTRMRESSYFRLLRDQGRTDLVDPLAFEVAYMVDRIQHCRTVIGPALRSGRTVITDRYALSSIGTLLLRLPEMRKTVLDALFSDLWFVDLCRHLIQPDVSFVLWTRAETGAERLRSRPGEADAGFDPIEYEELQQMLLRVAAVNDMVPIDSSVPPADVVTACRAHLDALRQPARQRERA
ncbi:dTMP kinase [Streptomyces afghaniensis]|uniref:dTMP kinase n=1 Tax=Streptomyces afghaniensis TaxID=66865 RepID=UPI0037AE9D15